MATTKIDAYEVMYSSNRYSPRIWLTSASQSIAQLIFEPNDRTLPSDTEKNLYYHLDDFQNVLDLLRNEGPIYLQVVGPSGENAIKTVMEMPGEGEV